MYKMFKSAILLSALLVLTDSVAAAASPKNAVAQKTITLEGAEAVLAAAKRFAEASGWPCVVAVTDPSGMIVSMERMNGANVPAGVFIAPGKARTAALFRRPTADIEKAINGPRAALVTAGDFVMMRGGLPLWLDGELVGAIGVSADTPDHDQAIAEAGASALK